MKKKRAISYWLILFLFCANVMQNCGKYHVEFCSISNNSIFYNIRYSELAFKKLFLRLLDNFTSRCNEILRAINVVAKVTQKHEVVCLGV